MIVNCTLENTYNNNKCCYRNGVSRMNYSINFDVVVNRLNDRAVEFCVIQLYNYLGFEYLKKEDVRKCDLIEKILFINRKMKEQFETTRKIIARNNTIQYEKKYKKYYDKVFSDDRYYNEIYYSNWNYYRAQMKYMFVNYASCVRDSRADKYLDRAMELLNNIENGSTETIMMIFLSLMRVHKDEIGKIFLRNINTTEFDVKNGDEEILRDIFLSEGWLNYSLILYPNYRLVDIKKDIGYNSVEDYRRKSWYINSVLTLAYLFQEKGLL